MAIRRVTCRAPRSVVARRLCPDCGHVEPLHIAYGYPTSEMIEQSERGEIALGGCVITSDSQTWRCRTCGREWGGPPSEIDGLAAVIQL